MYLKTFYFFTFMSKPTHAILFHKDTLYSFVAYIIIAKHKMPVGFNFCDVGVVLEVKPLFL